ncbi:hypothetical protein [Bacteriovorax sp. Seq25_V]|uniref:hypothetical protein n=1 Tax=Bacteriovorax sp. Seq25_V TaxID=1201288 RepID=UPI000389F21B|nr:hypothetical protein [Bacteriovorax sp. Seq25_V]EQC46147.1 hypothetical protein M900_1626 [Bacteriovorax sp. Seq25_V]
MKLFLFTIIFLISVVGVSPAIKADEIYTVIIKKHEEKQQSRWTLADWLATKQRISLMDQWLALNTESNLFEFVLSYDKFNFKQTRDLTSSSSTEGYFSGKAFFTFLGLEGGVGDSQKLFDTDSYNLNLRLLGGSQQSTHLNLQYGVLNAKDELGNRFSPNFFGVDFELYLLSFLGGNFKYSNSSSESSNSITYHNRKREYGVFIDIWFLRFYYQKSINNHFYNGEKINQNGEKIGMALYF